MQHPSPDNPSVREIIEDAPNPLVEVFKKKEAASSQASQDSQVKDISGQAPASASPAKPAPPAPPAKPLFPMLYPTSIPTQKAKWGVRFDYNDGARVLFPEEEGIKWRLTFTDPTAGIQVHQGIYECGLFGTVKKFFVPFTITVERLKILPDSKLEVLGKWQHEYDPRGKPVLLSLPEKTLGDSIAWFSYVPAFAEKTGAKLTVIISDMFHELFGPAYPEMKFVSLAEAEAKHLKQKSYATYTVGLFFADHARNHQPDDFRLIGLHTAAAGILGVDPRKEVPPKTAFTPQARPLKEPYVIIAAKGSAQCKYWNNPVGWRDTIHFLKEMGYKIVCIDRDSTHGTGIVYNQLPHGVEDETGPRPLSERMNWLHHAEFFIGTSSGLSWLAWMAQKPVIMISGFTAPFNEFYTPYRLRNLHVCHSCWHDAKHMFQHTDFLWCPRHKGTDRAFECSRMISVWQVKKAIEQLMQDEGLSPPNQRKKSSKTTSKKTPRKTLSAGSKK